MNKPLITIEEVLMGRITFRELPMQHRENLTLLVYRINRFFKGYEWPMIKKINDGYRRPQDTPKNGSLTSHHLTGSAIDLDDDDSGTVWKYVIKNVDKLESYGLWLEHPGWTHANGSSWLHFQTKPPKSGNRFFAPNSSPNPNPKFWDGSF